MSSHDRPRRVALTEKGKGTHEKEKNRKEIRKGCQVLYSLLQKRNFYLVKPMNSVHVLKGNKYCNFLNGSLSNSSFFLCFVQIKRGDNVYLIRILQKIITFFFINNTTFISIILHWWKIEKSYSTITKYILNVIQRIRNDQQKSFLILSSSFDKKFEKAWEALWVQDDFWQVSDKRERRNRSENFSQGFEIRHYLIYINDIAQTKLIS